MSRYKSWGRFPKHEIRDGIRVSTEPGAVFRPFRAIDIASWIAHLNPKTHPSVLPFGLGRSYGDVCLNSGQTIIDMTQIDRFLAFDDEAGIIRCEAGLSLGKILAVTVPRGWFLPVTPGTQFVTVGGAIANDVHGKNHHADGSFGCHVTQFELLRSDGSRHICSPDRNRKLFEATIGGLGLTGVITWAEFNLIPIPGPGIAADIVPFSSLREFFQLSDESSDSHRYSMAWIDCLARKKRKGRGIFIRGNFVEGYEKKPKRSRLSVPVNAPKWLLNPLSVRLFNSIYYRRQRAQSSPRLTDFRSFFYPLDSVRNWNRIYGRQGFVQYQFVVPSEDSESVIEAVLDRIAATGEGSFLAVLKCFGNKPSLGMLSFPREGVTLALDFPIRRHTLDLLDALDEIVLQGGGAFYPAKDARMKPETLRLSYPRWESFLPLADPAFSSSFFRRMRS